MLRKKTLIAAIMLVTVLLASCAEHGGSYDDPVSDVSLSHDKENTPPVTYEDLTAEEWLSTVREVDYSGYKFTIVTSVTGRFVGYNDSESGVEKAITKRNELVEKRYGVKIVEKDIRESELINNLLLSVSSGTQYSDLISATMPTLSKLAATNALTNLYSLPYYDQKAEFCSNTLHEAVTSGHTAYALFDELTMVQDDAWCTFFDKSAADADALYDLALNNGWTWDKLLEASKNSGFAAYSGRDDFAVAAFYTSGASPLEFGYGKTLATAADTDLLDETAAKIKNIISTPSYISKTGDDAKNAFLNGEIAFLLSPLSLLDEISDSDKDFGLLPIPSFDGEYRSVLDKDAHGIAVPAYQQDNDRTGLLLTALTAASYQHIEAAKVTERVYFDLRDNASAIILKKIYDSLCLNGGNLYSGGFTSINSSSNQAILDAVLKNRPFADTLKREKTQLESIAEKFFR